MIMIGSDNYEENDWLYPFLDCHWHDNNAIHHEWYFGNMYHNSMLTTWL